MTAYQLALSWTPLQAYLLDGDRNGLVSANKEGLFSVLGALPVAWQPCRTTSTRILTRSGRPRTFAPLPLPASGYFAIYAIGVQLGVVLLRRKSLQAWHRTVWLLAGADAVLWALWYFCEASLGLQTSRRLVRPGRRGRRRLAYGAHPGPGSDHAGAGPATQANLPYVLWTLAYNLPFLAVLLGTDLWVGYTGRGFLYRAINRNMLFVFLLVRGAPAPRFSLPASGTRSADGAEGGPCPDAGAARAGAAGKRDDRRRQLFDADPVCT